MIVREFFYFALGEKGGKEADGSRVEGEMKEEGTKEREWFPSGGWDEGRGN